jgi:cell wall-associated NlpC family hydrolase
MDRNWRVLLIAGVISLCSAQFVFASYSLGDSGDAVKDLQRRLTQAGCLVRADGRFNETTVSAVKKFQKKHNLDVDGVVGPVTYKALTGKTLKSKKHSSARKNKMSPGGIGIDDVSVSWHKPGKLAPRVQAIMEEAKKYVGVPYRFGGMTPSGFDCSGFIHYVFNKKGILLPRAADEQFGRGERVSVNRLEPGDLVFFSTYESGVSHSGLYLGDGYFISATSSCGVAVATMKNGYWHDRGRSGCFDGLWLYGGFIRSAAGVGAYASISFIYGFWMESNEAWIDSDGCRIRR